ncbi:hypothetical protein [Nocardiopsis halotolerans]|uniref:hypothetical protein n=1 Tax=Nocardiopsis halotolerans TaxID=124252 RepID=UPI00034DDA0C|nr:hypothetical protein [Nocardiopsis halotolerans]
MTHHIHHPPVPPSPRTDILWSVARHSAALCSTWYAAAAVAVPSFCLVLLFAPSPPPLLPVLAAHVLLLLSAAMAWLGLRAARERGRPLPTVVGCAAGPALGLAHYLLSSPVAPYPWPYLLMWAAPASAALLPCLAAAVSRARTDGPARTPHPAVAVAAWTTLVSLAAVAGGNGLLLAILIDQPELGAGITLMLGVGPLLPVTAVASGLGAALARGDGRSRPVLVGCVIAMAATAIPVFLDLWMAEAALVPTAVLLGVSWWRTRAEKDLTHL